MSLPDPEFQAAQPGESPAPDAPDADAPVSGEAPDAGAPDALAAPAAPADSAPDAPAKKPPFHSFTFSLSDRAIGRRLLRLSYRAETDDYELHVESGSQAVPETEFTRSASRTQAEILRDTLAALDAFSWEGEYDDSTAPGTRRWNVGIVFEKDVFSVQSFGGSTVPAGFDELLEALYQLDMPRPERAQTPAAANPFAGMAGMAGGAGPDLSSILPPDADSFVIGEMQQAMAELQNNPERFAAQLKEEFRHLPPEMQNNLLDMLAASGMGDRDYWRRFFGI